MPLARSAPAGSCAVAQGGQSGTRGIAQRRKLKYSRCYSCRLLLSDIFICIVHGDGNNEVGRALDRGIIELNCFYFILYLVMCYFFVPTRIKKLLCLYGRMYVGETERMLRILRRHLSQY